MPRTSRLQSCSHQDPVGSPLTDPSTRCIPTHPCSLVACGLFFSSHCIHLRWPVSHNILITALIRGVASSAPPTSLLQPPLAPQTSHSKPSIAFAPCIPVLSAPHLTDVHTQPMTLIFFGGCTLQKSTVFFARIRHTVPTRSRRKKPTATSKTWQ